MAKLTGDMIKVGLHVWAVGYDKEYKAAPVELVLTTDVETTQLGSFFVGVSLTETAGDIKYRSALSLEDSIYLGDTGIRPYNYDDRATQIFTTKEEVVVSMQMWEGRNPNFVDEFGDSIEPY